MRLFQSRGAISIYLTLPALRRPPGSSLRFHPQFAGTPSRRTRRVVRSQRTVLLFCAQQLALTRMLDGDPIAANNNPSLTLVAFQHLDRIETGDAASGHKAGDTADKQHEDGNADQGRRVRRSHTKK